MAKISNVFSKEEVKKSVHPKRITKWIHYTKLVRNDKQYCDAKDKEEIEGLADIIEADGMVLQDLLVKKLDADEYKIIAGHKRHAACKLLVEERGKKEFEFLPCFEQNISDIQAEFQIYSSNCHHEETPYEIMHKLERMQYLINNYPEEFPEIQGGRMVDRLAKKYNLSKSTVGEYLTISKNLGDTAMDEFQKGEIDKSAAVTLASMPEEDQDQALSQGRKTDKELKAYKKEVLEPTSNEILTAYDELDIREIDCPDRKETCKKLIERYGKSHLGQTSDTINISCTPKTITINGKEITWNRFVKLIEKVIPAYQVEVQAKKEKKKLYFEKRELQVSYETYDRLLSGQRLMFSIYNPKTYTRAKQDLQTYESQLEDAKIEVMKEFPKEADLKEKTDRLSELNALLNMDQSNHEIVAEEQIEEQETEEVTNKTQRNEVVPKFGTR